MSTNGAACDVYQGTAGCDWVRILWPDSGWSRQGPEVPDLCLQHNLPRTGRLPLLGQCRHLGLSTG